MKSEKNKMLMGKPYKSFDSELLNERQIANTNDLKTAQPKSRLKSKG